MGLCVVECGRDDATKVNHTAENSRQRVLLPAMRPIKPRQIDRCTIFTDARTNVRFGSARGQAVFTHWCLCLEGGVVAEQVASAGATQILYVYFENRLLTVLQTLVVRIVRWYYSSL